MTTLWLKFKLLSDATFGRGDGVASVVDAEVQHDEDGLPYLSGRALKGLLGEECAHILFALRQQNKDAPWHESAQRLFGNPGSRSSDKAILHVGNAQLPQDLRTAVAVGVKRGELSREQVLNSLTAIRHQTAVDVVSGAPLKETLRAMRVALRKLPFEAELSFFQPPSSKDLALLSACVNAWRHAGTGRNRGRGGLVARLYDAQSNDITAEHFARFQEEVTK